MAEFTVAGQKLRSGKMPARTQFHVMRRMAPILPTLQASIALAERIKAAQETGAPITPQLEAEAAAAGLDLIGSIGELSDDAANYILDNCLAVVEVQQTEFSGKWSKLRNSGEAMFSFDMMSELEIVKEVVQDNYGPFFRGALTRLSGSPNA